MPYNGTGVFQRLYNWVNDAANGILVNASRMDADTDDIADALSNCVTRDGQSPMFVALPMGGNKVTGLGPATLATDAAAYGQVIARNGDNAATANLPMGGFKFTGLGNGAAPTDSVNYGQVFNSPAFVTPTATTSPATTDDTLRLATVGTVLAAAFQAALPSQSLGFLRSSGTAAAFTQTHTGYAQNEVKGANIASAATINLTTATGNFVHITGGGTISGITIPVGAQREIVFDGVVTLAQSGALLLPGNANIVTAAGDRAVVRGDTAGAVVTQYQRANGKALAPFFPSPYVLLGTAVVSSAVASIDFLNVFTSDYDKYVIEIQGAGPSTASNLLMRVAAGGSLITSSNYYDPILDGQTAVISSSLRLSDNINTSLGSEATQTVEVRNANAINNTIKSVGVRGIAQISAITREGGVNSSVPLSGFRLYWQGGNFARGTVLVYGVRNTL